MEWQAGHTEKSNIKRTSSSVLSNLSIPTVGFYQQQNPTGLQVIYKSKNVLRQTVGTATACSTLLPKVASNEAYTSNL